VESSSARDAGAIPPSGADRFVVVGLFAPLPAGHSFKRRQWPSHVTLASNFRITAPVADLVEAVDRADVADSPIDIVFGGDAMFGVHHDVHVQLVRPGIVDALHARLADHIEELPGFTADSPQHWRDGYHPHVTHTPTGAPLEGETWRLRSIAIARLSGADATIVAASDLPAPDPLRD
jgi:hypothetical protein